MAIDARIIERIGVNSISPVLNTFQNALNSAQNRGLASTQEDRREALQPFALLQAQANIDLTNAQAKEAGSRSQKGRQQQVLKSVNDFALGNKTLIQNAQSTGDFTNLRSAMVQRKAQLQQQGLPTETTDEGIELIDSGQGGRVISALGDSVNLFNQQNGRGKSVSQRDFESKVALVKNDPKLLTPAAKAAAVDLGLEARASTSASERIASDPVLTDAVAESSATIAGAKSRATEGEKLKQQRKHKPAISALVKLAEKEAIERGDTLTALQRSKAALPGLTDAVGQLKELSQLATSTFGGKVFDFAVKQTGFGSTTGATSRAKFVAIVNNQVLPLLKETFGAAFTATEGESLKATMGDPDASPAEKMVQLDAFIDQKLRDIETKETQLDLSKKSLNQSFNFDAQGNLIQ